MFWASFEHAFTWRLRVDGHCVQRARVESNDGDEKGVCPTLDDWRCLNGGHGDVRRCLIDFDVLAVEIYLQKCRHDKIVFFANGNKEIPSKRYKKLFFFVPSAALFGTILLPFNEYTLGCPFICESFLTKFITPLSRFLSTK